MRPGRGAGRPDRYRAWRQGRWAESAVVALLLITGWRILARDWKSPAGEIDIVARRRRTIAFIEVKTRDDLMAAGEAIGLRQQQRILRAAGLYLARHPALAGLDARFDAVLVLPWRWPVFVRDAWRE
jgi:putative endonuclease